MTLLQMTKYLSVSSALPGPISMSHQPGRCVVGAVQPGDVGVARQRVADEDRVVAALAQRAVRLVGERDGPELVAALEGKSGAAARRW